MSMKDLPVEILNLVFEKEAYNTDKYTITQCQLTCKNWSQYVQRHLYRTILINKQDQFIDLLSTLSTKPNLGRYLKTLHIDPRLQAVEYVTLIRILLLKCPNLEVLEGSDIVHRGIYDEIREASVRGACKRLKKILLIKEHPSALMFKHYNDAMYCLRNSLEDLCLYSSTLKYSVLQRLNDFPKLRSLNIKILRRLDSVYQIGNFTKSCPDFANLKFTWIPLRSSGPRRVSSEDMVLDVQSTIPCPTVQCLDLGRIPVTKNMLRYIIHAFPNINCFSMDPISVFEASNDLINNQWVQFLVYLTSVKNYITVNNLYIADLPSVLTDYFDTINFNGNLDIIYPEENPVKPYITYTKAQEREKGVNIIAYFPWNQYEKLPQLLQGTGVHMTSLRYDAQSRYGSVYCDRHHFLLDQIFQQCPSLKELEISFLSIEDCNPEPQTNTTLTHLTLTNCDLSPGFFLELSTRLPSLSNLSLVNHRRFNLWEKSCRYHTSNPYGNPMSSRPPNIYFPQYFLPPYFVPQYSRRIPHALSTPFCRGNYNAFPLISPIYIRRLYSDIIARGDPYVIPDTTHNFNTYENPNGNSNNGALYPPESYQDHSRIRHNYIIKMPSTSFDTLTWERHSSIGILPISFNSINFKIETTAKTYYYYGVEKGSIAESLEVSYQKYFDIPTVFSMHIQCHDIKRLHVTLLKLSWKIDFTET